MKQTISSMSSSELIPCFKKGAISLWVLSDVESDELSDLIGLPWENIWDSTSANVVNEAWIASKQQRSILFIDRPEQDSLSFRTSEFVRIYRVSVPEEDDRRKKRLIERLKDKIENLTGLLCFYGDSTANWDDILLASELCPSLNILIIDKCKNDIPDEYLGGRLYFWTDSVNDFVLEAKSVFESTGRLDIVDLKGAPKLQVDTGLLEDISKYWTFLSSSYTTPPLNISQEEFDSFLNFGDGWGAIAAGAPYRRSSAVVKKGNLPSDGAAVDFVEEIINRTKKLESAELDPSEQLDQILIFAEPGSGITTLFRQAAMVVAQRGLPTLVSKPFLRSFAGLSLEKFIIDVQDRWLENRKGEGSGKGLIPFCLFVDTDGESAIGEYGLPRMLQSLGRKIILVRAMERSEEEIEQATNIYTLSSEVTADELVALGAHLRKFSEKNALEKLPSDSEWNAFHEGLSRINKFVASGLDNTFRTPSLFLVGIYPFLKERVYDENTLEQYYYKKWKEIEVPSAMEMVRVLSAAGVYGLSVPFDSIRRHPFIDITAFSQHNKKTQRLVDVFVKWCLEGTTTEAWHLYIRHAAVAVLLSRSINQREGDYPFSCLLPILERLTTQEADLWFAGSLSYRLGRQFKGAAPNFSLDTDTSSQRAARAIFSAIPDSVKTASRVIRHHQGRYHLHILRSCLECLKDSKLTALTRNEVIRIAKVEFDNATKYLKLATSIRDEREPVSNVYNTLALAYFTMADILKEELNEHEIAEVDIAINYGEMAIKHDPANAIALTQYIRNIHDRLAIESINLDKKLDLIVKADLRLAELIRLHEEKRWRNIDPIDAEIQIGALVQSHMQYISKLNLSLSIPEFSPQTQEAIVFLNVRGIVKNSSFEEAFKDNVKSVHLKEARETLRNLQDRSIRADLYLYKLLLADVEGRCRFKDRLNILERIARDDPEQFIAFRHDEAALNCQLNRIDVGEKKFKELREFRRENKVQWFWLNEKVLLDGSSCKPKELPLEVRDPTMGKAFIHGTEIQVKYQPYQFGSMSRKHIFKAFIRFTINGLQAVPKNFVIEDLKKIGLA